MVDQEVWGTEVPQRGPGAEPRRGPGGTTASSSSAMLEQHGSTRSAKSNVSSRVETSQVEFGPSVYWHLGCGDGQLENIARYYTK